MQQPSRVTKIKGSFLREYTIFAEKQHMESSITDVCSGCAIKLLLLDI